MATSQLSVIADWYGICGPDRYPRDVVGRLAWRIFLCWRCTSLLCPPREFLSHLGNRIKANHACQSQSTWAVNSLAHWLGETSFDDKHTPRDRLFTALVTIGEGYHNFHHEFPMDYRNAIKWYQYDPTKWFIKTMSWLGLASHLKAFPDSEVQKGQMTMELKKIKARSDKIAWPKSSNDLPIISWDECKHEWISQCQHVLIVGCRRSRICQGA